MFSLHCHTFARNEKKMCHLKTLPEKEPVFSIKSIKILCMSLNRLINKFSPDGNNPFQKHLHKCTGQYFFNQATLPRLEK